MKHFKLIYGAKGVYGNRVFFKVDWYFRESTFILFTFNLGEHTVRNKKRFACDDCFLLLLRFLSVTSVKAFKHFRLNSLCSVCIMLGPYMLVPGSRTKDKNT